ncbi:MAG: PA2928 family protein [Ferruginibacter sp.]
MLKKYTITGVLILVAIIAGFIFLLRGCLASYDERSAITPALFFEKNGKGIVFTIVKYGKATSYKSNGGSTFKSLSTNYFIQANDAETGELIGNKKIKHNSDVKFHPVTTMGSGNGKAWIFIGELLAYDPLTLEKFADKEIIESKNPQLKGKMPDEKTYYSYNNASHEILITATDGVKYSLSTATLLATAINDEDITKSPLEVKIKEMKKNEAGLEDKYKAYYERYRAFNKLYSEKKISYAAYIDSGRNFNRQQDSISEMKRIFSDEIRDLENMRDADKDRQRKVEDMNQGSKSYSAICTAVDTFNGKWYGLLRSADLEKPDDRFRYRSVYPETARNKMYTAQITIKDPTRKAVQLLIGEPVKLNDAVFLQGGFLLNKSTALPIHVTNDDGFIICYREKVGNEGNIMLARVDLTGNTRWTLNTKLHDLIDWIFTGRRLIILGNDNKEISSSDANLLLSIDMQNGKAVMYDYFKNAMRKE